MHSEQVIIYQIKENAPVKWFLGWNYSLGNYIRRLKLFIGLNFSPITIVVAFLLNGKNLVILTDEGYDQS